MDSYLKEYALKQHEGKIKAFLNSNKAMIEFSKMALRGTMLLNGAAIIPIVYSKSVFLYPCAITFGIGALLSALATSVTYLTQWGMQASWSPAIFVKLPTSGTLDEEVMKEGQEVIKWASRGVRWGNRLRFVAMSLVLGSIIVFGAGLYQAHDIVESMPKTLQEEQI